MSALYDSEPPHRPARVIPMPGVTLPRRHPVRRVLRIVFRLIALLVTLSLVATISLNWWTPPTTSYMAQAGLPVTYDYVSINHVSRYAVASVLVHEDDELGTRFGAFNWNDFWARAQAYGSGQKDTSGSTIPQQLVKNIYLWPAHDWVRKGIEAGLSEETAFFVSKQRILELYLNYAQFGPKLFGVCAASWYYYSSPPWSLTPNQAAQLVGMLPDPDNVRRVSPTAGIGPDLGPTADPIAVDLINGAANVWVPRQLANYGGWQNAVATIGIKDTAADHADTQQDADACSTMPADVSQRLAAEVEAAAHK